MQIKVEQLEKKYYDAGGELRVLTGVNCEFPAGKSVAIVGKSGVGKSTLLHLLGGLDHPSAGRVIYGDQDIFSLAPEKLTRFRGANVGFIFQFHHLLPEFDAVENVAMPLTICGAQEGETKARATELLTAVGLSQRLTHRPSQLSGGEQQRVAIARALVTRPRVVLADEPTGNLDYATAGEVQELLTGICRQVGTTLIVVTHNQELAVALDEKYEMGPGGQLTRISP
ncbi:MAG: ABC transporter ATP-binding protein [Deltaproteobacteria bacterium]|nr:ABC transporter ATP-binding protein [Deltaproteobacteria bacterium]